MGEQEPRRTLQPAFRILGSIEVAGPGSMLRLEAPRQRIVLAMLLLEPNRILSVDRLVDAVWDEAPPPTARRQIQICVSTIRRALAECGLVDVIATRSPGYQLQVGDRELDLYLFNHVTATARVALTEGRLADSASLYREALALWSGQPLAGIESRLVQAAAVQITEQMMATLEECIELELRLGRHHQIVGELLTHVATYPLRERLRAHLMVALYRCGRQAEALAVYRQAREDFAEEFGLEPSSELRRLEQAILTNDPELAPMTSAVLVVPPVAGTRVSPAPQLLPADVADFTGRTELLAQLSAYLTAPSTLDDEPGAVRVVAIAGPGGVGKTALALRLAHLTRADFPDGQLYAQLHGTEAGSASTAQALERFLRALGLPSSALPDDLEERAETYRNLLAGQRVLVVLDDAADERDVLPLLPGAGQCAVIVTSRFRLTGLSNGSHADLEVFDEDQAIEMLVNVIGLERVNAEPEAARELVTLCDRLPLALRIGAARLAARPHWTIRQLTSRLSDERRRLDELVHHGMSVRPSLAVAYGSLSPRAQRLFRLLSALEAPDFAGWVAAPLLDADLVESEDLLESIVDVRLLDADRMQGSTRYRFHDLVRVFAREQLFEKEGPTESRPALQRVLRAWLFLSCEAHQRQYGGDYTILHSDQPTWPLPDALATQYVAEPIEWFERERHCLVPAVRQASELGFDDLCWDLAMTAVTLFETRGYFDDWRDTHERALVATARTGNRRGQAAMLYSLGALNVARERFADATGRLQAALVMFEESGDGHGRALTLRHLAFIDRLNGDYDAATTKYQKALAGLRVADDRAGEAHVLGGLAQIRLEQLDYDGAEELLNMAVDIAKSCGSTRVEAQLLHRLGEATWLRGDLATAEQIFRQVTRLAHDDRDAIGEAYALHGLACVYLRRNLPAKANSALTRALAVAKEHGAQMLQARVCLALAELHRDEKRYRPAIDRLETALALFDGLGAARWSARVLMQLGEVNRSAGNEKEAAVAFVKADRLTRSMSGPLPMS
jgi:DNA-binding SARP family transcriptional activator